MAGEKSAFLGNPPQHISPFFYWNYVQIGDACRQGDDIRVETSGNPLEGSFRLLAYENDILMGANLINDSDSIVPMKRAILQCKTKLYDRHILLP